MKREIFNVTLANGTQVPFVEFEKWSFHKQWMHTDHPIRNVKWGLDHSQKMSAIVKSQYANGERPKPGHHGAANSQSLAVITPAGEFPSQAAAGRYYQVEGNRICYWIKDGKPGFYYKDDQ